MSVALAQRRAGLSCRLAVFVAILAAGAAHAADRVRHDLTVELDPSSHRLRITDRVTLPDEFVTGPVEFLLNSALRLERSDPPVQPVDLGNIAPFVGINSAGDVAVELARYRTEASATSVTLVYSGTFDFGLSDASEEYTRGFRETHGIVGQQGVYLAGNGFWYPRFDDGLLEFELQVAQPQGWHVISQGNGTSRDADGRARWDSAGPMEEIYLVGGPLTAYREPTGAVEALVYLRESDDALAARYLGATAQYLEMYRGLIGPYTYGKFALVENFWETGYGMPSFTLLGPKVIRFPFILHSSYPHEILHNWWGNSVFVDYTTGNWCEGLTAYLADHLVKEQRGQGAEYRRNTLQKYRNYVKQSRDFPLVEFRSRHSAATEAVGYGKTLMGFHMLRRLVGDEAFTTALARFYRQYNGRRASFDDLRTTFERVSGEELGWFFEPWIQRVGAAVLDVEVTDVLEGEDGFVVFGKLRQTQAGDPFELDAPVVVQTSGGTETRQVRLHGAEQPFEIRTQQRPLQLQVDPQFDLFRLLDPRETPASIGQIFGEQRILAVLPSSADDTLLGHYRELIDGWRSESHEIDERLDNQLERLPADRGVWVIGRDNRFAETLFVGASIDGLEVSRTTIELAGDTASTADHSFVVVRRHPENVEKAVGWLVVDPDEAFPGMGRKLPHYGKYSFLAFEGDEPTNVIKGQWATTRSPLRVDLRQEGERGDSLPPLAMEQRIALAELPPVFSLKALQEHVAHLASPELQGRGVGTAGLRAAADYIAQRFAAIGLVPGGADGSYFQRFNIDDSGPDGADHELLNVIGYLPGSRDDWKDQSFIVSAHYDHLGRGWPDVHQGDEGKIHPGADDNASGVAVMLELAANLAAAGEPARNLVFIAFTGEEAGRLGSKYFVTHPRPFALDGLRGMINLDTVGRLFDQQLSVLGTGTADEWQHIFRGCGFVTGIPSRNIPDVTEASDQMSFIEAGIPGVQLFTGPHPDYHRPGDTADKLDLAGLIKVATFVKEAVTYMAEREEPLHVTITPVAGGPATAEEAAPRSGSSTGRKVSFGSIPEFSYQGPGVQLSGVMPGSPAEKAGLQKGDILVRIDDREITDLRDFSDCLKQLEAGQTVQATIRRNDETLTIPVTLEAR